MGFGGFFEDIADSVTSSTDDLTGVALTAAAYTYGAPGALALTAYQAYKQQAEGGGDTGGEAPPSGLTAQELIKQMADSESAAGEEALYLRKQAMINNVL